VSAVVWIPRLAGPLDLRYDAGVHYVLGTALAEGRGYRLLNEPGAIEAVRVPPLLPMIVAAHQWLVGSRDPAIAGWALRCTYAGLFVVYGLVVYTLACRWLQHGWAVIATLFVLLHLQLLWVSDTLVAELPFACVTMLFLLTVESEDRRGTAALLGAAAYLLRTSGVALLAAWVGEALIERRWLETLLRAGLAALPILVWHAYVAEVESSAVPAYAYQRASYQPVNVAAAANRSYVDPLAPERGRADAREIAERIVANVAALPAALGESVSVRAAGPLVPIVPARTDAVPATRGMVASRAAFAAIGLAAAVGLGLLVFDGVMVAPLYWALALAHLAPTSWPAELGRALMPLAPVTAVGLVVVLASLERMASRVLQTAVYAAIGVLLAAELTALAVVFTDRHEPVATGAPGAPQRLFFYGPEWRQHDAGLEWLARAAPADAVVATTTPERLFVASGLHAVLPPFEPNPAEAERLLEGVPVDFLVIDDLAYRDVARRYAAPVVATHPERWRLVYGGGAGVPRIYRRVHSGLDKRVP
jgi:hypothetical protein